MKKTANEEVCFTQVSKYHQKVWMDATGIPPRSLLRDASPLIRRMWEDSYRMHRNHKKEK